MASDPSGQKAEVRRLADIALQAAAHERERRTVLSVRGKKAVRKGIVIGAASVAGFVLVSMLLRHRHHDEDGAERERSPGIFERAGVHFLTLVRWGVTASHLWTLAASPPAAAAETVPEA